MIVLSLTQKSLNSFSNQIPKIENIRCGCKIKGIDCNGRLEQVGSGPLKYLKCRKCGHNFDAEGYIRKGDVLIHKDDIKEEIK